MIRRFLAGFDRKDAHFYAGLSLLFAGLWLLHSLGLALIICGGILAGIGLIGAFMSFAPPAPEKIGNKR